jgi:hypothetical protein
MIGFSKLKVFTAAEIAPNSGGAPKKSPAT